MNRLRTLGTIGASFLLVASACGGGGDDGGGGALSVEDYAFEMSSIATRFFGDQPNDPGNAGESAYPLGGDLVAATELYTAFDSVLAAWESLTPPPRYAVLHADLVAAVDNLQKKVGDYLMDEALEEGEIQFDTIGTKVRVEIADAAVACNTLQNEISGDGITTKIFGDCEF